MKKFNLVVLSIAFVFVLTNLLFAGSISQVSGVSEINSWIGSIVGYGVALFAFLGFIYLMWGIGADFLNKQPFNVVRLVIGIILLLVVLLSLKIAPSFVNQVSGQSLNGI